MENYYDMLFKRKSVRKYDTLLHVSEEELHQIDEKTASLIPLDKSINVKFKIVKKEETTSKFGEYCLLLYSEKKENYLLNAGYMLEQMDLYFASKNIGACWLGLAKMQEQEIDGLDYVIMLAFGKSRSEDFRKNLSDCNRKEITEIWDGAFDENITDIVRYAPSACNSQPWKVISGHDRIQICRNTSAKSFIPPGKRPFFNTIDMGIFLCYLEIALTHFNYSFERVLSAERLVGKNLMETAVYMLK